MSTTDVFKLKLLGQHWIDGSTDPRGEPYDLTSHGDVALEVNGKDIAGCELPDHELGINQSAVALLQTVFVDHQAALDEINKPLFFHGCSVFVTCQSRIIDFRVRHGPGIVTLDRFYVTGTRSAPKEHYDTLVRLPSVEYARQVLDFGKNALSFLPQDKLGDEWEVMVYKAWRHELAVLVGMTESFLKEERVSSADKQRAAKFDLATGGL